MVAAEEQIRDAAWVLVQDGVFLIDRILYDEDHFGNILVHLRADEQVELRFVLDRGEYRAEIGRDGRWYYVDDLLQVIGVCSIPKSAHFISMIGEISALIRNNMANVFQAFDSKHFLETRRKIERLERVRSKNLFNLPNSSPN